MAEHIRILCVDNKNELLEKLETIIEQSGKYEVIISKSWTEGLEALENDRRIQAVVAGNRIAAGDGIAFLCQVGEKYPSVMRLVLADASMNLAVVEAIQAGAIDQSISTPWDNNALPAIASALRYRKLLRENKKISWELKRRDTELQEINGNLDSLVAKRTETLDIQNRVLQISQGVMDVLPVVVVGIDPDQVIVQCNEFARNIFPCGFIGPLGNDRQDVFPPEVNELIDRVKHESHPQSILEVHSQKFRVEVRRLHEVRSQGVVLVMIPLNEQ